MSRTIFYLTAILLWQGLIGCTKVGPDYLQPEPQVFPTWQAPMGHGLTTGRADQQVQIEWWTLLKDPLLTSYMHQAVAGNLDPRAGTGPSAAGSGQPRYQLGRTLAYA